MANMTLIETKTSTTNSVTFANISQTYTDLKILISSRDNDNGNPWTRFDIELNSDTTSGNYRTKYGYSTGSGTGSATGTEVAGYSNSSGNTADTFSNCEIYIPSYSATVAKSWTWNATTNQMATAQLDVYGLGDWTGTAPITQIKLKSPNSFLSGSTFYLYGIPNTTVAAKATGGTIYSDGIYNYHTFLSSGTFTPTQNITADYLVIAGGGGGGYAAGGGGAGGYRTSIGGTPLSLTAQAYTVTIGAGGTGGVGSGGVTSAQNTNGGNSVFSTITSSGGGRGANYDTSGNTGFAGGSGGGGGNGGNGGAGNSGSYSPVEGYAGGSGVVSNGGGGGGAGAVGDNGVDSKAGNGGAGSNSASVWAIATQTGVNGYYAGGGGGRGASGGTGGLGGGGVGCTGSSTSGTAGTVNTGSGGGSGGNSPAVGGNGGSGLVIIRYAI